MKRFNPDFFIARFGFRRYMALLICAAGVSLMASSAGSDTIVTGDGKEIKGIVVEDYRDRVVFSTVDGEVTVMKSDIRELLFDSDVDNLIKLAEQAAERRNYSRAMSYYNMALKSNPDSAPARQGMAYLRGNIFRKEEAAKTANIRRQQEIELYGDQAPLRSDAGSVERMASTLEKSTGMGVSINDSMPELEAVKPDAPSYEAGLRSGDILVSVWGKLTGYLSLKEILDLLVNKSAIEIRCVIERTVTVALSQDRTIISRPEDVVGASFVMDIDGLTVSSVKEGGPAYIAGVRQGDLVMAIDGSKTRYMPLKKALELIKISSAANVRLTIQRKAIIWRRSAL